MKYNYYLFALLLAGCGGGDGGDSYTVTPMPKPTVTFAPDSKGPLPVDDTCRASETGQEHGKPCKN